jgi:Ca2+-transporting ATPase
MSLVAIDKDGQRIIYAKGAPERLLKCCSHIMVGDKSESMEQHRSAIDAALVRAQDQALRVIAVTVKQTTLQNGEPESFKEENAERFAEYCDNTLLALVGISDPIRAEVPLAVTTCHSAGIDVKMITGDAKPTAVAIAREAGILTTAEDVVLTSEELAALTDDELNDVIPHLKVVARSTPMDKLRLVKAMHRQGEVVAMTGDGTNDAPALKFADVGISMGITGTEVAKEASDIVLVDDNFKSIVTGVWWGRTLYQNIQRFLQFQLTVNVVALLCAFFGPLFGVPLPLTVVQLLWINIIMDTFAAIALCTEPPREHFMQRRPIKRDDSIITGAMGVTILLTALFQVVILKLILFNGWFVTEGKHFDFANPDIRSEHNLEALTVFFTAFVLFQFWNIINSRAMRVEENPFALLHRNPSFLVIIMIIAVMQVAMVQCSEYFSIGEIFRTMPLSLEQWLYLVFITVSIIPVAWLIRGIVHALGLYGER